MLLAATLPPVMALLTAGSPVWRVRCDGCALPVDSLWSGEVWVWTGECPGEAMEFRFDREDGAFAVMPWPCTPPAAPLTEDLAAAPKAAPARSSAAKPAPTKPLEAEAAAPFGWSREAMVGWTWAATAAGRCYPPTSRAGVVALAAQMQNLPFERDRVAAILVWSENSCLTPEAASAVLGLVQDEARRLELLQRLVARMTAPERLPLDALFHLELYRRQARTALEATATK